MKPTTCSGLHATPLPFGPAKRPLVANPGSYCSSRCFVAEAALWSVWVRLDFLRLSPISHPVCFSLAGVPDRCCRLATRFLIHFVPVSPDRTLWSACYPCSSKRNSAPRLARRVPDVDAHPHLPLRVGGFAFRLRPVRLSSTSRFPSADLRPRGISGPTQAR